MTTISIRVPDDDLAEIDRRVATHGFPNRTAFLLGLALSDDLAKAPGEAQFERIDERLARLEAVTFGGS
jgi:Arc/MetJ-type ribon-helix-helix transcriptional regulator